MKGKRQCPCCCGSKTENKPEYHVGNREMTLAELPVGTAATVLKVTPDWRGRKKFADIGVVAGSELVMEAHAPFGGLLRVKIMETSMALHRDDAVNVMMKRGEASE